MLTLLTQFDPGTLLSFWIAGLLLNLTPGADFLLVTSSAIQHGPKVGRAAAVGINLGILVHLILAAAGLSALLIAYPLAYRFVLLFGAGYLIFMAWQLWFVNSATTRAVALSQTDAIKRGFLTNVLNPKTALFIFAFIPQFTNPEYGPIWQQMLLLGGIFLITGFVVVLLLATAAGSMTARLNRHKKIISRVSALCFVLLALRILFS